MGLIFYVAGAVAVAGLYAAALAGVGFGLAAAVQYLGRARLVRPDLATAFSLGLGVYGSAWILLGVAGYLRPVPALILLLPGLAFGAWTLLWTRRPKLTRPEGVSLAEIVVAGASLLLVIVLFFAALRPPFGDPVAFYLAWPKVIAASGQIVPLPGYEQFSSIWMLVEAHLAVLMMFGGETAAKLFVWLALLAALSAIWQLALACGCTARGALSAAAVLLTSTAVINVSFDGKTDLVAVAPALCAALWALRLGEKGSGVTASLIGVLVGTAIAAKLSYIPPLGAAMAVIFVARATSGARPTLQRVKSLLVWSLLAGIAVIVVVLPQLIKNAILFDAPLAPMVGEALFVRGVWYTEATTRWILLTYPIALAFGNYWAQMGTLSPLVLSALPFALIWRPSRKTPDGARLLWVTLAAFAAIVAWVVVAPSQFALRYFLGPLLLFAVPTAWLMEQAWRTGGRLLGPIVPAFAAGLLVLLTIEVWGPASYGIRYAEARYVEGEKACLGEEYCKLDKKINERLSPGSRLAHLSYYRYWLRPDILQCVVSPIALSGRGISQKSINTLGIDYLLVDRANYGTDYAVDWSLLEPVFDYGPNFSLYRVRKRDSPNRPSCVEVERGRWAVRH
jgi:hypothetical protein